MALKGETKFIGSGSFFTSAKAAANSNWNSGIAYKVKILEVYKKKETLEPYTAPKSKKKAKK